MITSAGRPAIGPTVQLRLPAGLLDRVDAYATHQGVSRAAWLRDAAEHELDFNHTQLAAMVAWMFQTGGFANLDIVSALEKPWQHREYLHASRYNLSLTELDELLDAKRDAEFNMDRHPHGSRFVETSPVSFLVVCPHDRVITDSNSDRRQSCTSCPSADNGKVELMADAEEKYGD